MATKSKKKVPSNRVQRIFFLGKKGAKSPHIKEKKSLKEPYCDNRFSIIIIIIIIMINYKYIYLYI
jgi:hypothetical protein